MCVVRLLCQENYCTWRMIWCNLGNYTSFKCRRFMEVVFWSTPSYLRSTEFSTQTVLFNLHKYSNSSKTSREAKEEMVFAFLSKPLDTWLSNYPSSLNLQSDQSWHIFSSFLSTPTSGFTWFNREQTFCPPSASFGTWTFSHLGGGNVVSVSNYTFNGFRTWLASIRFKGKRSLRAEGVMPIFRMGFVMVLSGTQPCMGRLRWGAGNSIWAFSLGSYWASLLHSLRRPLKDSFQWRRSNSTYWRKTSISPSRLGRLWLGKYDFTKCGSLGHFRV